MKLEKHKVHRKTRSCLLQTMLIMVSSLAAGSDDLEFSTHPRCPTSLLDNIDHRTCYKRAEYVLLFLMIDIARL